MASVCKTWRTVLLSCEHIWTFEQSFETEECLQSFLLWLRVCPTTRLTSLYMPSTATTTTFDRLNTLFKNGPDDQFSALNLMGVESDAHFVRSDELIPVIDVLPALSRLSIHCTDIRLGSTPWRTRKGAKTQLLPLPLTSLTLDARTLDFGSTCSPPPFLDYLELMGCHVVSHEGFARFLSQSTGLTSLYLEDVHCLNGGWDAFQSVFQLKQLKNLQLVVNAQGWPAGINALTNLRTLFFEEMNLEGPIVATEMTALERLALNDCEYSGLPQHLFALPNFHSMRVGLSTCRGRHAIELTANLSALKSMYIKWMEFEEHVRHHVAPPSQAAERAATLEEWKLESLLLDGDRNENAIRHDSKSALHNVLEALPRLPLLKKVEFIFGSLDNAMDQHAAHLLVELMKKRPDVEVLLE